ncbi:uncharacterized protein LOC129309747 [Prosopis cineraria]|uniref:uncharacterized protein LOC129309747 n=1 Tax=Prosopis cineraria TaxID=364024 RepID=UPI00240EAF3B|nr:uncharacterized protein LOC129309747 [Prosopis cineraria]
MEQNQKLELISLAIQNLTEEKRNQCLDAQDDDAEYQLALSRLLSELEMLKGEGALEQSEASGPTELVPSATEEIENKNVKLGEVDETCSGNDEIVKELKKLKRQNFITHCLLSVMIVLTVTWQISEVSLVLKVKDGLNHPFRAFGSLFTGMFRAPDMNGQGADDKEDQSESPVLPSLKIPDMPQVDIPNLGSNIGE